MHIKWPLQAIVFPLTHDKYFSLCHVWLAVNSEEEKNGFGHQTTSSSRASALQPSLYALKISAIAHLTLKQFDHS